LFSSASGNGDTLPAAGDAAGGVDEGDNELIDGAERGARGDEGDWRTMEGSTVSMREAM
jgi:hypothetical protein